MRRVLQVGDKTVDEAIQIIAEDSLCYQICNFSKGVKSIRTISKRLVGEWVAVLAENPDLAAEEVRQRLLGKSDIDRFEYGYRSTLYKLAQMALGLVEVAHSHVKTVAESASGAPADRLTVALKMYAAARGSSRLTGWESYDAWTHGVRTEFAEVNEGLLEVEGFDYGEFMRKYAISWQVANSKFSVHTAGERPPEGAKYRSLDENFADGVLTVEFEAVE